MGGKSSSSQTQQTSNTSIQQSIDSSVRSYDYSTTDISGQFVGANVGGNITVTDGGAFKTVDNAMSQVGTMFGDAMMGVEQVSSGAFGVAGDAIRVMDSNTREGFLAMSGVTQDAISGMGTLTDRVVTANTNLASALGADIMAVSRDSIAAQNNLAMALTQDITSTSRDAQNTVLDAARYAMQFADSSTRSDGQQLAINTNKTMMVMVAVVGVGFVAMAVWGKK